jgi:hypothetical protein
MCISGLVVVNGLGFALAQIPVSDGVLQVEWQQFLPGIEGQKIIQTSDGGYLVLARNARFAQGEQYYDSFFYDYAYLLEKLDSNGQLTWYKTYQIEAHYLNFPDGIIQTSDGGYAIGGGLTFYNSSFGTYIDRAAGKFCLLKLDAQGNMLWNQTYADPEPIGYASFADLLQTDNDSYVLIGEYDWAAAFTYGKAGPETSFMKVDSSGNLISNKTVTYGAPSQILKASDQGYTFLSYYPESGGGSHSQIVAVSSNGDLQWLKEYIKQDSTSSQLQNGVVTADGGYLLAGRYIFGEHSYGWLVKANSEGNILWDQTYYSSSGIYSVALAHGGGYIVGGHSGGGWIAKIDESGNIEAELKTTLGDPKEILPTKDGGYMCIGVWNQSYPSTSQKTWIAKIDLTTATTDTPSPSPLIPEFSATATALLAVFASSMLLVRKRFGQKTANRSC